MGGGLREKGGNEVSLDFREGRIRAGEEVEGFFFLFEGPSGMSER